MMQLSRRAALGLTSDQVTAFVASCEFISLGCCCAVSNALQFLGWAASGRRSGDQFCVYVGDRLVMSKLGIDQMKGVFSGEYSLDDAIKEFVRSQLSYRYLLVADDPTARALERHGLEIAKGQGADLLNSI